MYGYPIKTFHLAEGPGGFIEATLRMRNNPLDQYIGMTLIDKNDINVPSWKKSGLFMRENKNVFIETGADKTGNILSLQNFVYCKEKYKSSMDFITADGGFDFSNDFKNQENSIVSLLFAQIAYAVCMQKCSGNFVLKIFDCFMQHTIDLLYLLSSFYKTVYICKPQTSRYANSEKYIVCIDFIHNSCDDFYPYLYKCFKDITNISEECLKVQKCFSSTICELKQKKIDSFGEGTFKTKAGFFGTKLTNLMEAQSKSKMNLSERSVENCRKITRFLNIPITNIFITRLEEYNSILGQQQIENIHNTITLIETKYKNEKISNLLKINIQKSIQWCIKHKIPYNS
jgi:23S rRNA U2552 (ribose-2'-O)-methylase RlmE/FtsJ